MSAVGLTDEERAALDKLTEAIKAIAALPASHPSEYAEMVPHFHAIQEKIMARAAVRAHPEVFWSPDSDLFPAGELMCSTKTGTSTSGDLVNS